MMNFNKILIFIGGLFLLLLTACSKEVPDFSDDSTPEGTPVMIYVCLFLMKTDIFSIAVNLY